MTLLHAIALETYAGGIIAIAEQVSMCIDWKYVVALREQDSFRCFFNGHDEAAVFPVTHVDMAYGKTFILKHPYKELVKAFMATRGET